jgi:acyl-CoA synthetase (AMP-forming)/AMP-acid ligase II
MTSKGHSGIWDLDRLLNGAVEVYPTEPALITGSERAFVTYAELEALVHHLGAYLGANGLEAGDLVALEATNSVEFVAGFLGAAQARLVVAPIDPALSPEERAARLDRLGARVVLADGLTENPEGSCPTWTLAFTPGQADLKVALTGGPRSTPDDAPRLAPDDDVIMFTAGTTGQPKMVPWTFESIAAVVDDICTCYELSSADSTVAVMPFFHGHGLVAGLLAPLARGGCVLLPAGGRFSARTFWSDLHAARATWLTAVPTMLEILTARADADRPADFPGHLRFVRTCSAPLNPETASAFHKLAGGEVLDAYGMTETTHQVASQPLPAQGLPEKPDSVGLPTGISVRIVGTNGYEAPVGIAGEICLKGPTLTRGYLEDAQDTAGSFTDGWFHTGDLGFVDEDGYLSVKGRIKAIINRGGEKIAPEHVEEVLDQHPAVAESAVLGQPDPTLGERVVALLVPASGHDLEPAEVAAYGKDRLARYEVPTDFKVVSAIPHTPKGDIDRVAALATYQSLN